jgi:hypothetical protein
VEMSSLNSAQMAPVVLETENLICSLPTLLLLIGSFF